METNPLPSRRLLVESEEELEEFMICVENTTSIAFDIEGVNLSRVGKITLVTIAAQSDNQVIVFLFDFLHYNVKKVIHCGF